MTGKKCTLVIPTRDRDDVLAITLRAVAQLDAPTDAELVIVDNASTDNTPTVAATGTLAGRPARVLHVEEPGVSRARNAGAAAAQAEILVFLDDDMRPARTWLTAITGRLAAGEADAAASLFELVEETPQPWLTDDERRRLVNRDSVDPEHPFLVGGAMAITRRAFDEVGGFEPELGPGSLGAGGEDLLMTLMLEAAGRRIATVGEPRVEHFMPTGRITRSGMQARAEGGARSDAWIARHWFGRTDRLARAKALALRPVDRTRSAWHDQMAHEQSRPRKRLSIAGA
jgi:glycosyltransferase involved in cell wall biosynthesis